ACAASATADWIAPTWLAISSVAFEVWPASDFTSEATTAKPFPAAPARAASMVALSASRLVCPAIARIRPTTSPIWVAASPSSDMVRTVRRASVTARPATAVERVACSAMPAMDAASSSTDLPAGGKLVDGAGGGGDVARGGADPLLGGAGIGRHLVGGAVELGRSDLETLHGLPQLREYLIDRLFETADGGGDHLAALLAGAVGIGL